MWQGPFPGKVRLETVPQGGDICTELEGKTDVFRSGAASVLAHVPPAACAEAGAD